METRLRSDGEGGVVQASHCTPTFLHHTGSPQQTPLIRLSRRRLGWLSPGAADARVPWALRLGEAGASAEQGTGKAAYRHQKEGSVCGTVGVPL